MEYGQKLGKDDSNRLLKFGRSMIYKNGAKIREGCLKHYAHIRLKNRLLEFRSQHGLGAFCVDFLSMSVSEEQYPHVNKGENFVGSLTKTGLEESS